MKLLALVFCVSLAAAWAPLLRMERAVPGSYIVMFNERPANMATVAEVEDWLAANFNGISKVVKSVWLMESEDSRFRGFAADLTMEQVQVLQISKDISYIEEDAYVQIDPIFENDTRAPMEDAVDWGIDRVDQRCLPLNGVANPCAVSNSNCNGGSSVVFVVDTGVRRTHTEFEGRVTLGKDFATASSAEAAKYNGDCNGHGTHVAGSVAGKTYGVAKKTLIIDVRVLSCAGSGTTQNVIDGINFVGNNMQSGKRNILSASVGGGYSATTNSAIDTASGKGVVCVVAAGNDNKDAANYSPASAARAITVGATDRTDTRSSFSNFGASVNVFAPGSSITSAWYTSDTATNTISGTSMATPIVSGSIAVMVTGVSTDYTTMNTQISNYATRNVVKNAGSGSKNFLVYDRWNDGTSTSC